jgi:hypothetical protein
MTNGRSSGTRRRAAGRVLVGVSGIGLAVAPWLSDMNRHHTFGPGWGPHARLHGTAGVLTSTGEGALVTALAFRRESPLAVAAAVPALHWFTFNLAALVPGTSIDEVDRPVPRLAGRFPVSLVAQNVLGLLALAGWGLHHWGEAPLRRDRRAWRAMSPFVPAAEAIGPSREAARFSFRRHR